MDNQDLYYFLKAYNSQAGAPNYIGAFDYNGDGKINLTDLTQMMNRRNKHV